MRTTDEIVAEVCSALSVERVEIRPAPTAEPTQQIVLTAPFSYFGNDRLDVSPTSQDPIGGWFAPSRATQEALRCAESSGVSALVESAHNQFEWEYLGEMRVRYGIVPGSDHWSTLSPTDGTSVRYALARGVEPVPAAWDALLAMREVTLVCGCAETARCHRVLLARILEKLGARYAGEVR